MNRSDLLYDLQHAVRQLHDVSVQDTPAQSVKMVPRERGSQRQLNNRLTQEQVHELVTAFHAGTTRMELAKRYGIGRTSVAKLLRAWRKQNSEATNTQYTNILPITPSQ